MFVRGCNIIISVQKTVIEHLKLLQIFCFTESFRFVHPDGETNNFR